MSTLVRISNRKTTERFVTPILGIVFGLLFFVIYAVRGDWTSAVTSLAIMAVYSAVLLTLGRRSETIGLLGGDVPDERGRANSLRSLAFTGEVLILVVIAMFIWEVAHGRDGNPWAALGAIAGVSFGAATAWNTRHG
jgi:Na+/melibiose symporter-like transporter